MDHGSLGDEAVSRPSPLFDQRPARDQSPHSHHSHRSHHSTHSAHSRHPYLDGYDGLNSLVAQTISPDSHAADNSHAHAANSRFSHSTTTSAPDDSVEPDDFYRSYYRDVQTTGNATSPPLKDPMASAVSSPRQPPSLRSNGSGTTPKHSSIPTHRNALRSSQRSTSSPIDNRPVTSGSAAGNGYNGGGTVPTSVKDLKKKFDQPASRSPTSARKASSKPARDTTSSNLANGRPSGSGASARQDAERTVGTRGAHRPKVVTDNPSASSQSFASRVARPRNGASTNLTASRSTTQRSSGAASGTRSSQGSQSRQNGLLFGEILPDENDSVTAGFGIDDVRPRRASESSTHSPAASQMGTPSDLDLEPTSPTEWYRAANSGGQSGHDQHASKIPTTHTRTHSDIAGSKLTVSRADCGATRHDTDSPMSPASPASPTSRLPVMVKRRSDTSGHTSPVSTRSNSPSTFKRTTASGRSRQQLLSASRAKTPTGHPATQPKNSTLNPSSSRKAPPSNISTPQSHGRVNAYVSVPAPKLSPSLRSSRPRQSVATATTASSRKRVTEGGASPTKQSQRLGSKADEATPRRRKLSVGPIDFAQRRETIKLAYSKSIRESQAREARQAAAEKRKRELAAVARAKAEAEAVAVAAVASATAASAAARPRTSDGSRPLGKIAEKVEAVVEGQPKATTELPTLEPTTDQPPRPPPEALKLEIPGSFPNVGTPQLDQAENPLSAVSNATTTTEFDPEQQTEPPRPETGTAAIDNALGVMAPSLVPAPAEPETHAPQIAEQVHAPALQERATYRSPFDDDGEEDDSVSIKISLDTSAQPQMSPQVTPTRTDFNHEVSPAPPPAEDDEYVARPYTFSSANYETTVTILGPENDFKPLHNDLPGTTVPSSTLPHDELPVNATSQIIAAELPCSNDAHLEDREAGIEQLGRIEDFYVGSRLHENIAALRNSTLTSSDPGIPLDEEPSPADYHKIPDTSHSLSVPSLLAPANRLSQHSAWTDFSFGSDDRDAGLPSVAFRPREPDSHDRASFRMAASTGDLSTCDSSVGEPIQSPDISPLDRSGAPSPPMLPTSPSGQQNLSHLESIEHSAASCDSQLEGIATAPERAPPDPPSSISVYERESTLYLEESRPSSYLYDNDDEEQPVGTGDPQRGSQHGLDSLEPSSVSLGDTLVEKQVPLTKAEQEEQKRLRQRQLVIRELIDTEDAFVRDMSVVEEIYKGTAEACPNLDAKTIKVIFRNTDEIIAFHAALLIELKEGASAVYTPKGRRSPLLASDSKDSDSATLNSVMSSSRPDRDDEKDRFTSLGPVFSKNIEQLKAVHEAYLRSSDNSSKRLLQIQEDEAVMVWLNECNAVAKELTSAWNLDSLLIKPMQRITKYPDIITHLLKYTPENHPDREALIQARTAVMDAIDEINRTKKNFELVGQIVNNRKRKESDVRAGLARAFGKRVDKLQISGKTAEDEEYQRLQQQFGDDYLRLQVVLRDVEYYTRNVATYVHEFLQYLSSMELVMRLQPSRDYAHLESKWVQFNVSMRDVEKIALEKHLSDVRKHVIEPFEQVIRCYGNPSLAMKKRAKRRLDYEKFLQLKANGKKVDKQLAELVEQYEALNDTLKKELPKLSAMTAQIGNICLGKFISIQASWFLMWKEKVKAPLHDVVHVPELSEIVSTFQREFSLQDERAKALGILNPTLRSRASQSTNDDSSSIRSRTKSRPSDLLTSRGRGLSINSDHAPTLPTPDFAKRNSGQFSLSPASSALPSPGHYYRDYYSGINSGPRGGSGSPVTPDPNNHQGSATGPRSATVRPSTGRSFDSASLPRQSSDSTATPSTPGMSMGIGMMGGSRRDSNSTFNSSYPAPVSGGPEQTRRLSGLFHSALPLPDGPEENHAEDSAASSRGSFAQGNVGNGGGYNVLWLAASLFEFNIETTKHEAGYPYLTYQAGEIFDVIAEKGELWLAKNQDDPRGVVGWIWSKHFAKLADS